MARITFVISVVVLWLGTGCAIVKTPTVQVGVIEPIGSHDEPSSKSGQSAMEQAPYAEALLRVIHQQDEVREELEDRDWEDLVDEVGDWARYVRELSGYAPASHDPDRFRWYCDQLLESIDLVRRAARAQAFAQCQRSIDACDPLLNRFIKAFPITASAASIPAHKEPEPIRPERVP